MDKETVDEVVAYIIPIHNNLAARISIMYRFIVNDINSIKKFNAKQLANIKKDLNKLKKDQKIDKDMYKKAMSIHEYFESCYVLAHL
ncbi:hypothetical protein D3C87_82340 [compost metagenome]